MRFLRLVGDFLFVLSKEVLAKKTNTTATVFQGVALSIHQSEPAPNIVSDLVHAARCVVRSPV